MPCSSMVEQRTVNAWMQVRVLTGQLMSKLGQKVMKKIMPKQYLTTVLARTPYDSEYFLVWTTDYMRGYKPFSLPGTNMSNKNDIQLILEDKAGNWLADAICHYGSYGAETGRWEVMADHIDGSVDGYLTFKEVLKHFNRAIRNKKKKLL